MTASTLVVELVGSLAWPGTVLFIALIFRRQLRAILQRVGKIEYPGGSITLKEELSQLERKKSTAAESAPFQPQDLRVFLYGVCAEIELELFRVLQIRGGAVSPSSLDQLLTVVSEREALPKDLLNALEELSAVVSQVRTTSEPPRREDLTQILTSSQQLLHQVHKHRLVVDTMFEFASHGLWHIHPDVSGPARHYYWWSAVAAECPTFEYDYSVYLLAATRYNQTLTGAKGIVGIVSLEDYVSILRFRESELKRVLEAEESGQQVPSKEREWNWPEHWGDVGWSGPVAGARWSAERELLQTRRALTRYETIMATAA